MTTATAKKKAPRITGERLAPQDTRESEVYLLQSLLGRYGFIAPDYVPGRYDDVTRAGVSQFQSFYGIYPDEDGVCDQATIDLLNRPRCGVPDVQPRTRTATGRIAPYVTVGARWEMPSLRFKFLNATPDLAVDRQRAIIREAFTRWSAVSSLAFREVAANEVSELQVAFHRNSHGDGNPFDEAGGPDGNTLAHAFFPPPRGGSWAGALHFDEFETWKDAPGGPGTRLYNVALHEIGHLLGLAHSQDQGAIMYAYYAEDRNDLRPDDVSGIQSLYGAPAAAPAAIALGQKVTGFLAQTNAEVRYQITLQNKLLIRLDGPDGQDFDVYVRHGSPAGRENGQYDAVSYGVTADELITIANPRAGTYHVLVHSYRGSGNYSLEVDVG
jgi:peptidoglycan hydrolase-like protein with peptidoglycan-binding domain